MAISIVAAQYLPRHSVLNCGGGWIPGSFRARIGLCCTRMPPGLGVNPPGWSEFGRYEAKEESSRDLRHASPRQKKEEVKLGSRVFFSQNTDVNSLLCFNAECADSGGVSKTRNEKGIADFSSNEGEVASVQAGRSGFADGRFGTCSSFQSQLPVKLRELAEPSTNVTRESSESLVELVGALDPQDGRPEGSENIGSESSSFVSNVFLERKDDSGNLKVDREGPGTEGFEQQWFPYLDQFRLKDATITSSAILELLDPFLLEENKERIGRVIANRTYSVCLVVEGLHDLGNIYAVLRSADALGFQSVHAISNENNIRYKRKRKLNIGSEKWLDVEFWNTTQECLDTLRRRGYRIAATHVAEDTVSIIDIDWTVPTAVVFGHEYRGVSKDALDMSDLRCSIPMNGMVDSFNVSVAAGILMHHAVHDRIARLGKHGDLLLEEQQILEADFYLRHCSQTRRVLDRLLDKK